MARTSTAKTNGAAQIIPPVIADSANTDDMAFDLRSFLEMAGVQLPGWKRVLFSFVAALASGYLIGSVAAVLIDILFTGAIAVTGSMFVAWLMYSVGIIVTIYLGFKAGAAVSRYILGGKIDAHAGQVKDTVGGWFSFGGKKEIVAA